MPDERAAAFITNTQSSRTWVKSMDLRRGSLTSQEPLIKSVPCLFKEKWPFPMLQTLLSTPKVLFSHSVNKYLLSIYYGEESAPGKLLVQRPRPVSQIQEQRPREEQRRPEPRLQPPGTRFFHTTRPLAKVRSNSHTNLLA